MTRTKLFFLLLAAFCPCFSQTVSPPKHHAFPPKSGVTIPGIQIPLSKLQPVATFSIGGSPDWIAIGSDIWVSNMPKGIVTRIDPRTNTIAQTLSGFNKPCSGLAIGFGSLWVPNCGDKTLARVDLTSGKISKSIAVGIANSEGGLTVGAGSVWMLTDNKSTLTRIDPTTNAPIAAIALPEGCFTAAFGFGSVWVTCTQQNAALRISPETNSISCTIPVGPEPRFLSVGEGSVWTLNQGNGSITRISPDSNKVVATIAVGIPGEGGDISVGEGSVWATSWGFPLARIDPKTNLVVQQFVGQGGDAVRSGNGSVWLSNYKSGVEWKLDPVAIEKIKP